MTNTLDIISKGIGSKEEDEDQEEISNVIDHRGVMRKDEEEEEQDEDHDSMMMAEWNGKDEDFDIFALPGKKQRRGGRGGRRRGGRRKNKRKNKKRKGRKNDDEDDEDDDESRLLPVEWPGVDGFPQQLVNSDGTASSSSSSSGPSKDLCKKRRLVVDFADIGWSEWIISPKSFEADYCAGECPFPMSRVSLWVVVIVVTVVVVVVVVVVVSSSSSSSSSLSSSSLS